MGEMKEMWINGLTTMDGMWKVNQIIANQVNKDQTLLYTIARTSLPKDILDTVLTGEYDEPKPEEIEMAKQLYAIDARRSFVQSAESVKQGISSKRLQLNEQPDGLWHEQSDCPFGN